MHFVIHKLAHQIKEEIRSANTWLESSLVDKENKSIASARKVCAMRIANNFSIDMNKKHREEFLQACGLKEGTNFSVEEIEG